MTEILFSEKHLAESVRHGCKPVSYTHLDVYKRQLHPNTFTIPEGYYPKVGEGAKITSLVDPNSKMSKSDPNPNGYILLMDKPEDIMRKFKRAVTDSDSRIIFDPQNKPGVSNLLQIYAPVSYTHLDVYKRQGQSNPAERECQRDKLIGKTLYCLESASDAV